MRILIDIGHPAHVHLFKNFAKEMINKGNKVLFTIKEKEFEKELLISNNLPYHSLGKHYNSKLGKILGLIKFNIQLLFIILKFKPHITLSHGSMYLAQTSWLMRIPHISFEDTFNFEQIKLYKPFTKCILTSDYKHPELGYKNIKYSGYHELAYLHPNNFTANKDILNQLGIINNEKYVIIRFVSWNATHDKGLNGISYQNKVSAVKEFSKYAKVFISSESELPNELSKYKFSLKPEKMHDAMAFASLVFGESATMSSEAVVLGVPSIYLNTKYILSTHEQEIKYNLVCNYTENTEDQKLAIKKGIEILRNTDKSFWKENQQKMLSEKIDVTAFLVWFIENYPQSVQIMKNNPDYQKKFK